MVAAWLWLAASSASVISIFVISGAGVVCRGCYILTDHSLQCGSSFWRVLRSFACYMLGLDSVQGSGFSQPVRLHVQREFRTGDLC